MNNIEDKTEILCLGCNFVFKQERPTEREKTLNPRGISFCPICNENTNHMRIKALDELLEKLGVPAEKKQDSKKGYQYTKRRGE